MIHCRFEGGEHDGASIAMGAPYVPQTLWICPAPGRMVSGGLDVIVVGTDRLPLGDTWKGLAVLYQLDRARSDARMDHGAAQGEAVYIHGESP
jgi:hypothetical protein